MLSTEKLRRSTNKRSRFTGIWHWLRFLLLGIFCAGLIYSGVHIGGYLIEGNFEQQSLGNIQQTYAKAFEGGISDQTTEDNRYDVALQNASAMQAYKALTQINKDAVGWLAMPGTDISHPIAQANDNTFYLQHGFEGERSARGCVFMDCGNSADDRHIVLYGHHMKDGSMFGTLPLYEDPAFYELHSDITLNVQGTLSRWKIFSVRVTDDSLLPVKFSDNSEFEAFVIKITDDSKFDTGEDVSVQDTILTLSTCDDANRERFVIHAKRLDEMPVR